MANLFDLLPVRYSNKYNKNKYAICDSINTKFHELDSFNEYIKDQFNFHTASGSFLITLAINAGFDISEYNDSYSIQSFREAIPLITDSPQCIKTTIDNIFKTFYGNYIDIILSSKEPELYNLSNNKNLIVETKNKKIEINFNDDFFDDSLNVTADEVIKFLNSYDLLASSNIKNNINYFNISVNKDEKFLKVIGGSANKEFKLGEIITPAHDSTTLVKLEKIGEKVLLTYIGGNIPSFDISDDDYITFIGHDVLNVYPIKNTQNGIEFFEPKFESTETISIGVFDFFIQKNIEYTIYDNSYYVITSEGSNSINIDLPAIVPHNTDRVLGSWHASEEPVVITDWEHDKIYINKTINKNNISFKIGDKFYYGNARINTITLTHGTLPHRNMYPFSTVSNFLNSTLNGNRIKTNHIHNLKIGDKIQTTLGEKQVSKIINKYEFEIKVESYTDKIAEKIYKSGNSIYIDFDDSVDISVFDIGDVVTIKNSDIKNFNVYNKIINSKIINKKGNSIELLAPPIFFNGIIAENPIIRVTNKVGNSYSMLNDNLTGLKIYILGLNEGKKYTSYTYERSETPIIMTYINKPSLSGDMKLFIKDITNFPDVGIIEVDYYNHNKEIIEYNEKTINSDYSGTLILNKPLKFDHFVAQVALLQDFNQEDFKLNPYTFSNSDIRNECIRLVDLAKAANIKLNINIIQPGIKSDPGVEIF